MERLLQLRELAGVIAAVRAQQRVVRIVLRNTDRFGLIHLYFARGELVQVEGHGRNAVASLADLATWGQGAIRVDLIETLPPASGNDPELAAALSRALADLEVRGVIFPAPPVRAPSGFQQMHWASPSRDEAAWQPTAPDQPDAVNLAGNAHAQGAPPAVAQRDRLTEPQWQLLAIAVRQVTEHAGQILGMEIAEGLVLQALGQAAVGSAFLEGIELDQTGWLRARETGYATQFSRFEGAEAIATLLTNFEARCAHLLGARRAQELIATAVAPLRPSLQQIGITIAAE